MSDFFITIRISLPNGKTLTVSSASPTEPTSFFKQALLDYQETAHFTNYKFVLSDGKSINDFVDLMSYCEPPNDDSSNPTLNVTLIPLQYDIKKARVHLKRVRDIISYPPTMKLSSKANCDSSNSINEGMDEEKNTFVATGAGVETENNESTQNQISALKDKLPNVEQIFTNTTPLSTFYSEVLLRVGSIGETTNTINEINTKSPSDCIKSVSLSGWNPPNAVRKVAGDLLYIEVVTSDEGSFHITATPLGFYLNKSNRHTFDPSPASQPYFSHELLNTILGISVNFRTAWNHMCLQPDMTKSLKDRASSIGKVSGPAPLDAICTMYLQGRGDGTSLKPQWNVPTQHTFIGNKSGEEDNEIISSSNGFSSHMFDWHRMHEDLCDTYGAEEVGAAREW